MKAKLTRTGAIIAVSAMALTGVGMTVATASTAHAAVSQAAGPVISVSTISPEARQVILDQIIVLRRQLVPVRATTAEKVAVRSAVKDLLISLKPVRASAADRDKARAEVRVLRAKVRTSTSGVERTALRAEIKATWTRVAPVRVTAAVRKAVMAQITVLRLSVEPKRLTRAQRVEIEQQIRVLRRQLG